MTAFTANLRGVPMGEGTNYRFRSFPTGILGYGTVTAQRIPRADQGQLIAGRDRLVARSVVFDLVVHVPVADIEEAIFDLSAAWRPVADQNPLPLNVTIQTQDYVMFGTPLEFRPSTGVTRHGATYVRCVFGLTDPRMFAATADTDTLVLGASGTLTLPVTLPVSFSAPSGVLSNLTNVNAGTVATEWSATFYGPVTNPRIILGETGEEFRLDTELLAGQFVTVDSLDRTVLLGGTSPQPQYVPYDAAWWQLPAGTSTVRYRADTGTGNLSFARRHAWQ